MNAVRAIQQAVRKRAAARRQKAALDEMRARGQRALQAFELQQVFRPTMPSRSCVATVYLLL